MTGTKNWHKRRSRVCDLYSINILTYFGTDYSTQARQYRIYSTSSMHKNRSKGMCSSTYCLNCFDTYLSESWASSLTRPYKISPMRLTMSPSSKGAGLKKSTAVKYYSKVKETCTAVVCNLSCLVKSIAWI